MNKLTALETLRADLVEAIDTLVGMLEIATEYKIGFTTTMEQEQKIIRARKVVAKYPLAPKVPTKD